MTRKVGLTVKRSTIMLIIMGVAIGAASWDGKYNGGDIALARFSYRDDYPIDIWGGFSLLFYGNLPDFILPWGAWLLTLQLFLVSFGLNLLKKQLSFKNKISALIWWLFVYVVLVFSGNLTRDSTLFSFCFLGFCMIYIYRGNQKNNFKFFWIGILFLVIGFSFRPWLGFISSLFLLFSNVKGIKLFAAILITLVSPLAIDNSVYYVKAVQKVNPEFQVILMDAASMTCISNSKKTAEDGAKLINLFNKTNYTPEQICGSFKPSSWQSIGAWQEKPTLHTIKFSQTNSLIFEKIELSTQAGTSQLEPEKIRQDWLRLIKSHPKDYLQVKFFQASQLLIAGDTFGIRWLNSDDFFEKIRLALFIPYDIAISMHLISPLATALIGGIFIFKLLQRRSYGVLPIDILILFPFLILGFWISITAVAFIGDNGRYVYSACFFFYTILLAWFNKIRVDQID
jgi:hypothetical protein